jgi:acetyl esterase/lipase
MNRTKLIIFGSILVAIFGLYWIMHVPSDFIAARQKFHTKLVRKGPVPERYKMGIVPPNVRVVQYPSGKLQLMAWYAPAQSPKPRPALVYFHGGFSFSRDDYEDMQLFADAGFNIFCPTFRAENGNPGNHEMFYGELDDARAAIEWLKKQPEVDPHNIFTFGHSAGGVISALLSIYPNAARLTASAGGMYDVALFEDGKLPFDTFSETEMRLRVFPPNAAQCKTKHFAYVGDEDVDNRRGAEKAKKNAATTNAPLTVVQVPGTHEAMLEEATKAYFKEVQAIVGPLP